MLRVVADTNVLISAFIANGPPHQFLRRCLAGHAILVTSPRILEELGSVLRRPKFKLSSAEALRVVGVVAEVAEIVDARERPGIVPRDPDDDMIVSAAIDGRASYIVSGDKALLEVGNYEGIQIMTAASFLKNFLKEP
ncbi:MAG TPA: putative toxin-antitoxin system toxin component, PIN family [Candidatus Thermoplasmatota archaeon]|jgi:uncharacterized protein|nr:putative toxin-antitoxin system toxin component, PIN family [Candidatus Thermoplasmatota archaeon]